MDSFFSLQEEIPHLRAGRHMARPCGKTDGEENLLMKAIEKDVFYVVFPALSRDLLCISLKERLLLRIQEFYPLHR